MISFYLPRKSWHQLGGAERPLWADTHPALHRVGAVPWIPGTLGRPWPAGARPGRASPILPWTGG